MLQVNVYTKRGEFLKDNLQPGRLDLSDEMPVLPLYHLCEYTAGSLKLYGFSNQVNNPDSNFVMAPMTIPAYFDQSLDESGNKFEVHGIFLIDMGEQGNLKSFFGDEKVFGSFGCPKRVLTTSNTFGSYSSEREYFTFNNMRFYPFIQPDFTVGYYVCDAGMGFGSTEPRNAWQTYSSREHGVALDFPLAYDPTLGLYITRAAHIVVSE